MYREEFVQQVKLLLQCIPSLRDQKLFALKGGTAINMFLHNLPRLSIDIDLTYVPFNSREKSLIDIQTGLNEIKKGILKINPSLVIKEQISEVDNCLLKLFIYNQNAVIKIEPNFIVRGTLFPVEHLQLCKKVSDEFGVFLDKIPVIAPPELYAGKICAALSRQHPRDLFDIKLLLDTTGITPDIRQAFVVYLASNSRPMHELLRPNLIDIKAIFEIEFQRMTTHNVSLQDLLVVRDELIKAINCTLTGEERKFLISIKEGEPKYELMPFKHLNNLPAIQWKLMNIKKMSAIKHKEMLAKLKDVLEI